MKPPGTQDSNVRDTIYTWFNSGGGFPEHRQAASAVIRGLLRHKRITWAQFLSLPALMLYGLFFVYPLIRGIGMSLTDGTAWGRRNL
jgi:hypothetical protein